MKHEGRVEHPSRWNRCNTDLTMSRAAGKIQSIVKVGDDLDRGKIKLFKRFEDISCLSNSGYLTVFLLPSVERS